MLRWACLAIKPLFIGELREVVSLDLTDEEWDESKLQPRDLLISACANLVCLESGDHLSVQERFAESDLAESDVMIQTVRLNHPSVKQYLFGPQ